MDGSGINSDSAVMDAPPAVLTDEELKRQMQIQVIDASQSVQDESADQADEYLRQQTTENGFKGFIKKIWYGNLARDYIRQRQLMRTSHEIIDQQNIYAGSGSNKAGHDLAMAATIERVTSDYGLLHNGETNVDASEVDGGQLLAQDLKQLVARYAVGDISDETLKVEKDRLVGIFGARRHEDDRHKGQLLADNVIEVARNAKAAISHSKTLADIDAALDLKVADVRLGVRTSASRELTDRVIDKLYSTKIGSVVNETTLATAAAVGIGVAKFTVRKIVSAVGSTVAIGAGSAVIAGARETHRVKQERRLHSRQMAEGGELYDRTAHRRQQMEATRYQTTRSDVLNHNLRQSLESEGPDKFSSLLQAVTETQARIDMSDRLGIDLISYESKQRVEQQRLDLDLSLAEAKVALKAMLESNRDKLTESSWSIDEAISHGSDLIRASIEGEMSEKDQAFHRLQAKRALASAAIGFAVGAVIGTSSQEIRTVFDKGLQGVFEHSDKQADRVTELAGLFNNQQHTLEGKFPTSDFAHSSFHQGINAIDLPKGYHITDKHDLVGPDGKVLAENIKLGPNGTLTKESEHELMAQGLVLHVSREAFKTSHTEISTQEVSASDYVSSHPEQFTNINRELWYDNNSPYPNQNELGTWWGGVNNTGINAQGNFVLNVSHMTPTGSFEGSQSVNPYDLISNHQLALAVSLDQNNQNQVILIPFDSNGNATIDASNPVLSSVFSNQSGHAVFTGVYAEVVQIDGQTSGMTDVSVLSTVVGSNSPGNIAATVQSVVHATGEHVITHIEIPTEKSLPVEVAPVVPVYARRGLEDLSTAGPGEISPGYYAYGYDGNRPFERYWPKERSPRLVRNPNARLDPGTELSWYRAQQQRLLGSEYVSEIDGYIDSSEELKRINNETKAIVCIPVAAASEADNIYRTLSLFAGQDQEAKDSTVILLNLNWPETITSDTVKMELVNKTRSEIERAKADFPDLNLAVFEKVWSEEFIKSKQRVADGKLKSDIYGTVIKVLYDTAALAMDRAVRDGRRQGETESIIITNDADTAGMSRHYLRNYLNAMERRPDTDVFSGTIRRGVEAYKEYPGYGVISNFYALLNMVNNRRHNNGQGGDYTTEGPNAAIRVSTYAAIGGVEDRLGAGADAILGRRIAAARSSAPRQRLIDRVRPPQNNRQARPVAGYVPAAQIDTLPDRLLGAYKKGQWIAFGWDGFDDGDGYEDRTVSMADTTLAENVDRDIDAIARRIEINIEGFVSNWYRDPATASAAIALCFGVSQTDDPTYQYSWSGTPGWDGDGQFIFKFTDKGKEELKKRLLREQNGRFDPFGSRVARRVYSRVNRGNTQRPLAQSRLLS